MRTQQACTLYESNVLGSKGPRKMRCIIPEVREGKQVIWRSKNVSELYLSKQKDDNIAAKYKENDLRGMMLFHNKPPKWNEGK